MKCESDFVISDGSHKDGTVFETETTSHVYIKIGMVDRT
jgi:hypothetical protein